MVKRSTINVNLSMANEYGFIDQIKGGTQFGGVGTGSPWLTTGGPLWTQNIDEDGWPNYSTAVINKRASFGGIYLPSSSDFAGPYTIDGNGSGTISFSAGSWTLGAATGVSLVGNTLTVTDQGPGVRWTAQLTYSGVRQVIGVNAPTIDPLNTGKFLKNVRFYRTEDTADLAAGKLFRSPWKQTLVDLNPSAIRFMNWTGGNDDKNCRFENRTLPSHANWQAAVYNWVAGPRYGETTGVNQYSLASVTGTPASMQHGELAICRIGSSTVRQGAFTGSGVNRTVTGITNENPGVVTCPSHGFNTGDVILHQVTGGMENLHYLPCTITVLDENSYSIGVDTTSFGSFAGPTPTGNTTTGTTITGLSSVAGITVGMAVTASNGKVPAGTVVTQIVNSTQVALNKNMTGVDTGVTFTFSVSAVCNQYISLQVGSGNDRTAYPVLFSNAVAMASHFGNGYIVAGDYKTFYFDKTISFLSDGSGNLIYGAWIFNSNGVDKGHNGGLPLEICTALINELMEMNRSDGEPVDPIHMWVCVPHWALLSSDPDYSAESNYATNMVDVILNGANGYLGLNSSCDLFVEYSNETWNGSTDFAQSSYLSRRGYLRWGTAQTDRASMVGLRSYLMCKDLQAAFPGNPRIKYVLAGWGTLGIAPSSANYLRVHGTESMLADELNPNGDTPMSVHDFFAWAAYLYNDHSNPTYSLATCTAAWLAAGDDLEAKEAACALYVQGIKTYGGQETIDRYYETLLPAYAAAMVALGKQTIMYEGGWDRDIAGSDDEKAFLTACKKSRAWASALRNAFNHFDTTEGAEMPADYIEVNYRWGHAHPDLYAGGVEGAALDLAWQFMALRNQGKRQMRVKT